MMLALYKHQIQHSLISEYSLKPFNLVLCRQQIFHKRSCTVFGGVSEIWGLHIYIGLLICCSKSNSFYHRLHVIDKHVMLHINWIGLLSHILIYFFNFYSSYGQNLQTSTYFWENCFAVFISIYGLVMFLYFIGKVQVGTRHLYLFIYFIL
jgi:hypothetical protein